MRLYVESDGDELMDAMVVAPGTPIVDVLAAIPGVRIRPPNRWERAIEWIEDEPAGRLVNPELRIQHPLIEDPYDFSRC